MSLMAKLTQRWDPEFDGLESDMVKNLSHLIASRAPIWGPLVHEEILRNTILNYGIHNKNASSLNGLSPESILEELKEQVMHFESRLSQVVIGLLKEKTKNNHLSFSISAVLRSKTINESILLDSYLDLSNNKLNVRTSTLV